LRARQGDRLAGEEETEIARAESRETHPSFLPDDRTPVCDCGPRAAHFGVALHSKVKNALDEARILVLGAQVLLGFQYRAFFEKGFDELPPADRWCELAGLLALLVSVGALFLPASRHRIVEQGNDSERFHKFTMLVMRVSLA